MVNVTNVFTFKAIATDKQLVSQKYDNAHAEGYFSAQLTIHSGTGTLTLSAELSNNGVDFMVPTGESAIGSLTNVGGPDENGKDIFEFSTILSQYIRYKVVSTGNIVFSLWIARQ